MGTHTIFIVELDHIQTMPQTSLVYFARQFKAVEIWYVSKEYKDRLKQSVFFIALPSKKHKITPSKMRGETMQNLICYKQMPVWTKESLPQMFQEKHNTKVKWMMCLPVSWFHMKRKTVNTT